MNIETKSVRDISIEIDQLLYQETGLIPVKNIELELNKKQDECTDIIFKQLDDFMIIFDEGIKTIIKIHDVCELVHSNTMGGFSLAVLSAKMVSLLLGIRKMIYSGLVDCVKNLQRPLIETIDIFLACLNNEDISADFGKKSAMYDNNKFWKDNFAYGKVNKEIVQLFTRLEASEEYIEYFTQKRKDQKNFLSNSIHSSFNSAFVNYLMCTLDGEYSNDLFGKVTTAYPNMLLNLIEDINLLNQVFYTVLERKLCSQLEGFDVHNDDILYNHHYMKYDYLYSANCMRLNDICNQYSSALEEARKLTLQYEQGTEL